MFKEAGLVEKYETGIRRILRGFETYGLPVTKFEEIGEGFRVTVFNGTAGPEPPPVTPPVTPQVTEQVTGVILKLVAFCVEPKTRKELMVHLDIKHREYFCSTILARALQRGLIEATIPDKPQSSLQKYRLTDKGRRMLPNGTGSKS